jgi:hypothetical protein
MTLLCSFCQRVVKHESSLARDGRELATSAPIQQRLVTHRSGAQLFPCGPAVTITQRIDKLPQT